MSNEIKINWSSVRFGDVKLNGVVSGDIRECQRFNTVPWLGSLPVVVASHAEPFAHFVAKNVSDIDAMVPGRGGVVSGVKSRGKESIGCHLSISYLESVDFREGNLSMKWASISQDGHTTPVSYTLEDPPKTPDAIMFPEDTFPIDSVIFGSIGRVSPIADEILEVDRSKGERSYIRLQPKGRAFVTKSMHDTIHFPMGNAKGGKPRYRWELQADGIEYGYLV
jgi:hypothetical protein